MKNLMFYSYKGGSGRTVASANVAVALAQLGKKVMVMDLDLEAPGLQTVFGLSDGAKVYHPKLENRIGIQDYLRGNITLDALFDEAVINITGDTDIGHQFATEGEGGLDYLPAMPQSHVPYMDDPVTMGYMEQLVEYFEGKGYDFIILDAASGIRETFSLSMHACHRIFVFFRWSQQHLEGSKRVVEVINKIRDYDASKGRPYHLVPSVVPDLDNLGPGADDSIKKRVERMLAERKKGLLALAGHNDVFHEIPEIMEFKWLESVVSFQNNGNAYKEMARKILNGLEEEGN